MEASTFKLKTPHISGGRSHIPLAKTDNMTIGLNYYIPGRKNKLHTHPGEDHTFVVMDGQATFYNKEHQPTVLNKGEGIMLPENHYYYFASTGDHRSRCFASAPRRATSRKSCASIVKATREPMRKSISSSSTVKSSRASIGR